MPNFSQTKIAAKLQDAVSQRRAEVGLYHEIAQQLPLASAERLLDVGTGSGLQLKVIHEMAPNMQLFGLDISRAAIGVARCNLAGIEVDLRAESIEQTSYANDFFDIVTCNASMSYWENPVECFNEIYRILKPGGSAIFFEPQEEIDMDAVVAAIRAELADESRFRQFMAINLHKFGLRWGQSFGLKLYSKAELEYLAAQSRFGNNCEIERITLQNLPIFVCITLLKVNEVASSNW